VAGPAGPERRGLRRLRREQSPRDVDHRPERLCALPQHRHGHGRRSRRDGGRAEGAGAVTSLKRWPGWLLMAVVVAAALTIGVTRAGGPRTNEERVEAIAKTIKCPVCRSESVFDSKADASQNIRDEIARQVAAGRTDDQ